MRFTENHHWVCLDEKGIATVGITTFAQKELGEIVYVELPPVGHRVALGEEVAVLESNKAAADLYTPLSGEIQAVNTSLQESTSSLNESPEGKGWLFKMALSDPKELDHLLSQETYLALITPQ
jgi:glycine cleavage system H protein